MLRATWFRVAFCAICFCVLPLDAQVTAYTHATMIDGTGRPPVPDSTLVVKQGRILDLGQSSKLRIPAGATVTDESGRTIIPGIIDLHVHVDTNTAVKLRQFALYGVTSVLSMGNDSDEVLAIRNKQRSSASEIRGARVYTVNQRFEFEKDATTVGVARAKVDELAAKKVDAVKLVVDSRHNTQVKLSPEIQLAIIDEAHKEHLRVLAHMYELSDAKFLLEHGIDLLAHNVRDTDIDDRFIADMKKRGIALTPTLTGSLSYYAYADPPAWLRDPFFLKFADPQRVRQATEEYPAKQKDDPVAAQNRADYKWIRRTSAASWPRELKSPSEMTMETTPHALKAFSNTSKWNSWSRTPA
jgi:hypothetical protein